MCRYTKVRTQCWVQFFFWAAANCTLSFDSFQSFIFTLALINGHGFFTARSVTMNVNKQSSHWAHCSDFERKYQGKSSKTQKHTVQMNSSIITSGYGILWRNISEAIVSEVYGKNICVETHQRQDKHLAALSVTQDPRNPPVHTRSRGPCTVPYLQLQDPRDTANMKHNTTVSQPQKYIMKISHSWTMHISVGIKATIHQNQVLQSYRVYRLHEALHCTPAHYLASVFWSF